MIFVMNTPERNHILQDNVTTCGHHIKNIIDKVEGATAAESIEGNKDPTDEFKPNSHPSDEDVRLPTSSEIRLSNSLNILLANQMQPNYSSSIGGGLQDDREDELSQNLDMIPRRQDARINPSDNFEVSNTSLSPMSAGLNSEMEYVVQTIAALAQAKSCESTDSNANVRINQNKSN